MKRLFNETITRVYDYSNIIEADRHVEAMKKKGWMPEPYEYDDFGTPEYVYTNGQDEYKWSVRFHKTVKEI
jgi:hypothetical protein